MEHALRGVSGQTGSMDVDFELETGCVQDEVAEFHQAQCRGDDEATLQAAVQQLEAVVDKGTLLIKAAKTDWSALNVAQQTACHQLGAAVASATQALQKFQASARE